MVVPRLVTVEPIRIQAPNPGVMTIDGTNTWVIPGPAGTVVIDPGPDEQSHLAAIRAQRPIVAVALTHRHADHSAAVESLAPDAPVFAASARFAAGVDPVSEGQLFHRGGGDGGDGVVLRVLHTPGHTEDSVCFAYEEAPNGPILFTGDTLLGGRYAGYVSRVGGDLGSFLESLERLAALAGYRGFPGHGPLIPDVASHARRALDYRRSRLATLAKYLAAGGGPDPDVVALDRYPDHPERRAPAAWMVQVELDYLAAR